ncbi:MAG: YidC/Oxa1 family membrane protein insertase [Clostridia bacterium]|nr:YidC/Oxa1 family membrane protein insertase [Clostridia bacterium]
MGQLFNIINIPFGAMIRWFNQITGNYLIALLLFAIVVKIVLSPLAFKQQKNQIKQAKLRPLEMAIRRRYAGRNDKVTQQKVQQEVLDLYQKEGYSPMSGCLPLLIQFPIIISLYQIIRKPLTYICSIAAEDVNVIIGKLQSFGLFEGQKIEQLAEDQIGLVNAVKGLTDAQFAEISMIENVDKIFDLNFNVFGVLDLSQNPALDTLSWLWVIPILTFITSFIGMKISRKFQPQPIGQTEDAAKSMKIMDFTMPLMSVAFTFMFSGAIGVYWIYQNVLNVIQTVIVAKLMPIPACTEEDVRAAEKQLAGKSKKDKKRELDPNRPRPRSLHHIDDDDEDIPASAPEADEPEEVKEPSPDAPKLKDDEQDKYRNK